MSDSERFGRQERLAEVGPVGQARIVRFSAVVRGVEGADVERAYLLGAGVGDVKMEPGAAPEPFPHAHAFRFVASREVGAGAWRALVELREALEIEAKQK
ncbi:MAG TPA: hypothetical protein VHU80_05320 [Polyangiaceae bacterium]|jgi:hypothetical protein|nr:hypothetical protein [Polyangiaceae bacterium]